MADKKYRDMWLDTKKGIAAKGDAAPTQNEDNIAHVKAQGAKPWTDKHGDATNAANARRTTRDQ